MSDKIFSQFVRRSEKYITDENTRPIAGLEGTNHVTNPSLWSGNEIYKGEMFINMADGKLYTSDGTEIITLNAPNGTIQGLQLGVPVNAGFPSNAIPLDFALSTGIAVINGHTYFYKSNLDQGVTDSDSQISPNPAQNPRMDFVFVIPSTDPSIDYANEFTLNIVVVEGIPDNNDPVFGETITDKILNGTYGLNPLTPVPENGLFVGMIWVPQNYLAAPPDHMNLIRPFSVNRISDSDFIFETSGATIIKQMQLSLSIYAADETNNPNVFYIQGQHVTTSTGVESSLWVCKETGYSNVFGDSNNYARFELVTGSGAGGLGLNDLSDVTLTNIQEGDILVYIANYQGSGLGKWVNIQNSGGTGGAAIDITFEPCIPTGVIPPSVDNVQDALCALDSTLALLVPPPPPTLNNIIPTIVGSFAIGKLPTGLTSTWYLNDSAGDSITFTKTFGYDINFNNYYAGTAGDQSTGGTIQGLQIYNGATTEIGTVIPPPSTNGQVTLDSLLTYNTFYQRGSAHITRSAINEGWMDHQLLRSPLSDGNYTEASTVIGMYYDNSSTIVSFTSPLTLGENIINYKWLSGISYYGLNTSLTYNYTTSNTFQKVYHNSAVGVTSHPAISTINDNPSVLPNYLDLFIVSNTLTFNISNIFTNSNVNVRIQKPFNTNSAQSNASPLKSVCTYGIVSTSTVEPFFDEDKRLNANSTAFDSTAVLLNAQSIVTPGVLNKGIDSNTMYEREFYLGPAKKSGSFLLEGITINDINPITIPGGINFLILHPADGLWYDCKKDFGTGGTGTIVDPVGAFVGTSSGGTLKFSFGTSSTGVLTDIKLRVIHNTNNTITKITITP